jgi:hypothetical protein
VPPAKALRARREARVDTILDEYLRPPPVEPPGGPAGLGRAVERVVLSCVAGACNSLCFRGQAINSVDVTIACGNPLRVVCCSASWSGLTPRRCASRSINRSEHPVSLSDPDDSGQVAIGAQWPNHGRRHLGDRVTGVRRPTGKIHAFAMLVPHSEAFMARHCTLRFAKLAAGNSNQTGRFDALN